MSSAGAVLSVARALAELRGLRSHDPVAADALEVVRATANTLEFFWLPALAAGPPDRGCSEDPGGPEPLDLGAPEQPRQPDGR